MKSELEDARGYIHMQDEASGVNVTHIDVEHPTLEEITEPAENSVIGGTDGGVFISLKDEMIERTVTDVEAQR